jgi:hypothetical protein
VAVLNHDSKDPGPCLNLQLVGRFISDEGLTDHMYDEGMRRAPGFFAMHQGHNTRLSQRWGGSHEGQLLHARHVAGTAQPGSLLAGMPIVALFYQLSHMVAFDENPKGAAAWATNPAVLAELRQACANSIDSAAHPVSANTFLLRTYAALVGGQCMATDVVKRQFAGLGDIYLPDAWGQLNGDPEPMYDMYKGMYG